MLKFDKNMKFDTLGGEPRFYPSQVIVFDLEALQKILYEDTLMLPKTILDFKKIIQFVASSSTGARNL